MTCHPSQMRPSKTLVLHKSLTYLHIVMVQENGKKMLINGSHNMHTVHAAFWDVVSASLQGFEVLILLVCDIAL